MLKYLAWIAAAIVVVAACLQLIPVDRTNPPVTREVTWDSAATQALARRACLDCHSNATVWPWDSYIAPASFLIANHVAEGRSQLNFSQWDQPNADFEEVSRNIQRGQMPPWDYVLMHPEAKLSAAETQQLVAGLQATFQQDPPIERPERFRP
ncbi:MAG: heme-binding domain-containing protein [Anaerolineales bacterium]|nr:heme-binding domain-containing protein [Anaerolineales bacterium]